jgi:hypothetical protein
LKNPVEAVGAQSYECTSSAHQQRRSGKIGRPKGPKKRREKQTGIYNDKVKDFGMSVSGKALQWFPNGYFFVFLAVDLGCARWRARSKSARLDMFRG